MPLKLEYPDKYQLWNDLVRGNADRLFVASSDTFRLRQQVPIEVRVTGVKLPLVVHGNIIGRRDASRRFAQGVYLRFGETELDKFRRFLSLQPPQPIDSRARSARRLRHEFAVRFVEPKVGKVCQTMNISEINELAAGLSDLSLNHDEVLEVGRQVQNDLQRLLRALIVKT